MTEPNTRPIFPFIFAATTRRGAERARTDARTDVRFQRTKKHTKRTRKKRTDNVSILGVASQTSFFFSTGFFFFIISCHPASFASRCGADKYRYRAPDASGLQRICIFFSFLLKKIGN